MMTAETMGSTFTQGDEDQESKFEKIKLKMIKEMSPYTAQVLNPFSLQQDLSYIQILKVAVISLTLFPLRLLLMFMTLLFAWLVCICTLVGIPEDQRKGKVPISGWRRNWAKPFIVSLARFTFCIGGWYWIPQKGKRASVKEAPILLVVPHSSFFDTVVVMALGCPGMVAIDATQRIPLIGKMTTYMQPLYVKSNDPNSRRQITEDIRKRVTSKLDFEQLLIFPEGGCGNRRALLQFKLGGFTPGVPVQPVFIRYKNNLETITWTWEGPGGWKQLWLSLSQFRIYCDLEFLPVYKPSELEQQNPHIFAENVQNFISRYTGTPTTKFCLEDARYLKVAKNLELPLTVALVKFLRLRKSIGNQKVNPKEELNNINTSEKICGDANAFAQHLNLERCPEVLKDFCRIIDQHGEGCVDFRVYAAALCLIRDDLTTKGKLDTALQILDSKKETKALETILLLWKGIPSSLASQKSFSIFEENYVKDTSRRYKTSIKLKQ